MSEKKLGLEQAFPMEQHDRNELYEIHHGMSKRFYAACYAMNLNLEPDDLDEDFIEDVEGAWYKNSKGIYFIPQYEYKKTTVRYTRISSFETRLVRKLYKIADELLRQENEV